MTHSIAVNRDWKYAYGIGAYVPQLLRGPRALETSRAAFCVRKLWFKANYRCW